MHFSRTCAILAAAFLCWSSPAQAAERSREFWRDIISKDYAVPAGETAAGLLNELLDSLGSPDPEVRDKFCYEIPATWIYRDGKLSPAELEALRRRLQGNLAEKIGSAGDDSVLLRSFSALDLSVIAAYENKSPYLAPAAFADLLDAALQYLAKEKDLRGIDPDKGWMHATAHTADLLKFLARSQKLTAAGQGRIVEGIAAKLDAAPVPFTHGEHERLARALLALVLRADFDPQPLSGWITRTQAANKALWAAPKLDLVRYDEVENTRLTLRSLYVLVTLQPAGKVKPGVAELLRNAVSDE